MGSQVWCCTPIILALGRLRQEDLEFKASLGYLVKCCLQKQKEIWVCVEGVVVTATTFMSLCILASVGKGRLTLGKVLFQTGTGMALGQVLHGAIAWGLGPGSTGDPSSWSIQIAEDTGAGRKWCES
jgi:hypothetical protein